MYETAVGAAPFCYDLWFYYSCFVADQVTKETYEEAKRFPTFPFFFFIFLFFFFFFFFFFRCDSIGQSESVACGLLGFAA